jgi:predicted kinase/N-acetylglutamate synthase-like GNAT family acetyltransferase
MSSATIRPASPHDAQAISDVVLRCLHEVNIKDYGPVLVAEHAKNWTVEAVLTRMREHITFIAVNGDEVLGVAGFDGKQARTVFVRPDWHGKGVGSSLMGTVEAVARETDLIELSLLSSITAQGFYARLGYQSVRDVFYGEERTILMQKPLLLGDLTPPPARGDLHVYAMNGVAFSGKSTAARRVADALGLSIISLDSINKERGLPGGEGIPDARWEETSFIAMARLRDCLQGRDAIVDDTFSHRFLRNRCRRVAEACGATFTILFLDTPLADIQSRRRANTVATTRDPIRDVVFDHHVDRFEYPESDEPVVRITCDQDLNRWIAEVADIK